ncbi:MAG: hypothetical protein AB3N16_14385 [Flavobacteriaceae bacterium]
MENVKYMIVMVWIGSMVSCTQVEEQDAAVSADQEPEKIALTTVCPDQTTQSAVGGFHVSAGSPDDLTKYRAPNELSLPIDPTTGNPYRKVDVVGMGIDGDSNLSFVWYMNYRYSAGTTRDLDAERSPEKYSYTLPINPDTGRPYVPENIVGMGIDGENNTVYTWYDNEYVSAGSPSSLGSKRDPYHYDLAVDPRTNKEFKPYQIRAIAINGEINRTIVYYQGRYISEGRTSDLDYFTAQNGAYCIKRRPALNINTGHFIGAGLDYTNDHVFMWFKGPQE